MNATASKQKTVLSEIAMNKESATPVVEEEPRKRGRGRPKTTANVGKGKKGKVKANSLPTAAVDVLLGSSKNHVADVNELRRKMEEDAVACGRHVQKISEAGKVTTANVGKTPRRSDLQRKEDATTVEGCALPCSPRTSSEISARKELLNAVLEVEENIAAVFEDNNDNLPSPCIHRPGKEPATNDLTQSFVSKSVENSFHRDGEQLQLYMARDCSERHGGVRDHSQERSPSLAQKYSSDRYGRQEVPSKKFPEYRRAMERTSFRDSRFASPQKKWYSGSRTEEYRSFERSKSGSPRLWRGGRDERSVRTLTQYYKENSFADHCDEDYGKWRRFSSKERRPSPRYERSSPENASWNSRYNSPEGSHRTERRNATPDCRASPRKMSRSATDIGGMHRKDLAIVKEEGRVRTSPVVERKERRQKQAYREVERESRERHGKKPVYLTLDGEGRPYGPGRPTWVAEINKLATGLDPSCTHIRKQTYEDVQTFKDRLNETFDYSGKLNEDYLRGLMGKAVTQRRGELIQMIKNHKKQPNTIDEQVWKRLEKLAWSKQRAEKSEQGRHANACRKTVGRTGSRGVNGVIEKMRSMLGRSPDPDEVEEELQRDKGFGGRKRKACMELTGKEKSSSEIQFSNDGTRSTSPEEYFDRVSTDANDIPERRRHRKGVRESAGSSRGQTLYSLKEVDRGTEGSIGGYSSYVVPEEDGISRDEYIQKLEVEILRLQAGNVNGLSSNMTVPSQSAVSSPYSRRQ